MGKSHGKNGKVSLASNAVANVTKWSVNETVDTADSTAMQDTAQTHIPGIPGWTGSADALYDPDDTDGQAALTIGASVDLKLYHDTDDTGKSYRAGTATVTGIQQDVDMGAINKISFTFTGNGALTTEIMA